MASGDYCDENCKWYREFFEMTDDEEVDESYCELGHSEIFNRNFCEYYES